MAQISYGTHLGLVVFVILSAIAPKYTMYKSVSPDRQTQHSARIFRKVLEAARINGNHVRQA